eukprot:8934271-Pyramimonas_sp.AAC.1
MMKTEHQRVLVLESVWRTNAAAQALCDGAALVAKSKPIRALFEFFCRDKNNRWPFAGGHCLK